MYEAKIAPLAPSDQFQVLLRVLVSLIQGAEIVDRRDFSKGGRGTWELQLHEDSVNGRGRGFRQCLWGRQKK